MEIIIFPTGKCDNECYYCSHFGEISIKFDDIGKTNTEKKALKNLFGIFSEMSDKISVTGGDPLLNLPFLESLTTYYDKEKKVVINPLSILKLELKKLPATRDTGKLMVLLKERVKNNTLNRKTQDILNILKKLDFVAISVDSKCFTEPSLQKLAHDFFLLLSKRYKLRYVKKYLNCHASIKEGKIVLENRILFFKIKNKARHTIRKLSSLFGLKESNLVLGIFKWFRLISYGLMVTGRLRSEVDNNKIYAGCVNKSNDYSYHELNCFSDDMKIFFEKSGSKVCIRHLPCCHVGMNPYIVFPSSVCVQDLVSEDKTMIIKQLRKEVEQMGASNMAKFLKNTSPTHNFRQLIRRGEELILKRTGKVVDIIGSTPSLSKVPIKCEVCYSLALELDRAKIKPEEWINYLSG